MQVNQVSGKGIGHKVVRKMASLTRSIATDSVENRCWLLVHQPKEPKNLAERLDTSKSKTNM